MSRRTMDIQVIKKGFVNGRARFTTVHNDAPVDVSKLRPSYNEETEEYLTVYGLLKDGLYMYHKTVVVFATYVTVYDTTVLIPLLRVYSITNKFYARSHKKVL